MPRSLYRFRLALLLALTLASAGCQLFPTLGGTNRYGVPHQTEPDLSELDSIEYE